MSNREADNTVKFTFDGPQSVDLNAIQGAIDAEAGVVAEPAVEAKVEAAIPAQVETTPLVDDEPTTSTPQSAVKAAPQQEELKIHKIIVDGQELEVTEADLKLGHMRHRDYTQKTQRVSAREKELDAKEQAWQKEIQARDQELAQLDLFLKNQAAVDAYREKAFGRRTPAAMPVLDPNTPTTPEQIADIARYNAEQVRLQVEQQIAVLRQENQQTRQAATESHQAVQREKIENQVRSHINQVLEKYPVLKKFEDIEESLMTDASRYSPRDLDEAKTRLSEAAERRYAVIRSIADDEKKQAAIKAAEVKRKSPEPPGGTAPRPAPGKKLSLDTKDQKALRAAAEEDLRAFMAE